MDTSQEKQIFRDDPRLRGATAMYDPSELPRRDADDPLSDEAYRKRFLEQSRRNKKERMKDFKLPEYYNTSKPKEEKLLLENVLFITGYSYLTYSSKAVLENIAKKI